MRAGPFGTAKTAHPFSSQRSVGWERSGALPLQETQKVRTADELQKFLSVSPNELFESGTDRCRNVARHYLHLISAKPFFHCIPDELLLRDAKKLALFRQPLELLWAQKDLYRVGERIWIFRPLFVPILMHQLARSGRAAWI
jgi:hypothetical protein